MARPLAQALCLAALVALATGVPVPRRPWDRADRGFAQRLAAQGEPIVLTGAPSAEWNVSWSLLAASRAQLRVKVRDKGGEHAAFGIGCCPVHTLDAGAFSRLVRGEGSNGAVAYLSMSVTDIGGAVEASVPTVAPFLVEDLAALREVSPAAHRGEDEARVRVLVWAGSPGVVAPPHHDLLHNFFTQYEGEKTFELLPPTSWRDLGLYPKAHVLHRNARGRMGAPSQHHAAPPPAPWTATLRPGDTLYVPPLWFHRVTSAALPGAAPPLSLNVWSPSAEVLALKEAWSVEPFAPERDWTGADVLAASSYFLRRGLADALGSNARARAFLRAVLATRFGAGRAAAAIEPGVDEAVGGACEDGRCTREAEPVSGAWQPGLVPGPEAAAAVAAAHGVRKRAVEAVTRVDAGLDGALSPESPELAETLAHLRHAAEEAPPLLHSDHVDGVMAEVCVGVVEEGEGEGDDGLRLQRSLEAASRASAQARRVGRHATAVADRQGQLLSRGTRRHLRRRAQAALRPFLLSPHERHIFDSMQARMGAAAPPAPLSSHAADPAPLGARAENATAAAQQLLGVREVVLAHWVEDVAATVGGPERAAEVLARCVLAGYLHA